MAAGALRAELEKVTLLVRDLAALVDEIDAGEEAAVLGAAQALVNTAGELQRRVVRSAQESGAWALDGWRSPVTWLAAHSGLSHGSARALQQRSLTMATLRHAREAALDGVLNEAHVRRLVEAKCRGASRLSDEIDAALTGVACDADLADFSLAIRTFVEHVEAIDSPDPAELPAEAERESFALTEGYDGWWNGQLHLSPEHGRLLHSALEREVGRYLQRSRDGDPALTGMTTSALRAQSLLDLVDAARRVPAGKATAPNRCHIVLTVRLGAGGRLEPEGELPDHYGCDASFSRLVLGARSEPLDVGRAQRSWPRPLAQAIARRDRGCRFPGCDQPPSRCDIHHCTGWREGGGTSVTNGALLCRHHHTFLHQRRWSIELDDEQQPVVRRPDGQVHTARPERPRRPG
ncbi:MAG: HNH endonuclease signature motif containing protein [Acidimicrobiales bacterium]